MRQRCGVAVLFAVVLGVSCGQSQPRHPAPEPTSHGVARKDGAITNTDGASQAADAPLYGLPFTASRDGAAGTAPEKLYKRLSASVVGIETRDQNGLKRGQASGFFVSDDGLVATNYHVIAGSQSAIVKLGDQSMYEVKGAVALDPEGDLALLQIQVQDPGAHKFAALRPSRLGETAKVEIGAKVYAIGSPLGLLNTFAEGLVSGRREVEAGLSLIQTTAPISPGSSGGPLVDDEGNLLGVTTAFLVGGQNLNFAVPADRVATLLRDKGQLTELARVHSRGERSKLAEGLAKEMGLDVEGGPAEPTGQDGGGEWRRDGNDYARKLAIKEVVFEHKLVDDRLAQYQSLWAQVTRFYATNTERQIYDAVLSIYDPVKKMYRDTTPYYCLERLADAIPDTFTAETAVVDRGDAIIHIESTEVYVPNARAVAEEVVATIQEIYAIESSPPELPTMKMEVHERKSSP